MRRWTAIIEIGRETFTAAQSGPDLQDAQLKAAAREAGEYLQAGLAEDVTVQLYKTTKAHGTVRDLSAVVYLDRAGRIRYQ